MQGLTDVAEVVQQEEAARELNATLNLYVKSGDNDEWAVQIADFILSKTSFEIFMSQAAIASRSRSSCQPWFYQGMLQKIAGQPAGAMESFRKAIAAEHKYSTDYVDAQRGLKALEAAAK